jgi:NAD+ diphosphatase
VTAVTFQRAARVLLEAPGEEGLVVPARGSAVVVDGASGARTLRRGTGIAGGFALGTLAGTPVYAEAAGDDAETVGLRDLANEIDEQSWQAASLATQLVDFARSSRYCGVCAAERTWGERDLGRACPNGHETAYPRISPCAIVLIHDGGRRVLLGKRANWPVNRYSLFAGFVEQGESLEDCARREVHEEIGVTVDRLRYAGSQSWPFPSQLMLGFTARYASGEIVVDPEEIEDARWFDLAELPPLPPPLSIARRILERHAARHSGLSARDARIASRAREQW